MINYKIDTHACNVKEFVINGIKADYEDFITLYDHDRENAPNYGCGDMICDIKDINSKVCKKYGINTDSEYNDIANDLCEKLSIGYCEYCS
jgi:hypothetical protein